jgi:S-adenosylmethionine:tRNA ribosyltransferase-isomerase
MHPKHLSISDYTYDLPDERIAKYPLRERDLSKLLIYKNGEIKEDVYRNISNHIPGGSLLIFNNTRVIPARILFKKETGGVIEIFCLEPFGNEEYVSVMGSKESSTWKCMIGGASKWKEGSLVKKIYIDNDTVTLTATLIEKLPDAYVAEFRWQPGEYTFSEIIEHAGKVPLPPYIKREVEDSDKERYQTIYAEHKGSVAAPTAGLHFTPAVFNSLKEKNIRTDFVTLHVGAGTFKPVKAEVIEDHEMHAEWIDVSYSTIENMVKNIDNIVAVGTTSLRTIESLYWMGLRSYLDPDSAIHDLEIHQWDVYEEKISAQEINAATVLSALLSWMKKNEQERLFIKTQILIAPGYKFRIARALITNFHQPRSTLLLLVAAITKDWKRIYDHALKNDFRFLSYGDGCLISIGDGQ